MNSIDRMVAAGREALVELRQERRRLDSEIAMIEAVVANHQPEGLEFRQDDPASPVEKVNGHRRRDSRDLLQLLIEDGPSQFRARDLQARGGELGLSKGSVSGGLHRLLEGGAVERVGWGEYRVVKT